mgnify:CR=1 FL=1
MPVSSRRVRGKSPFAPYWHHNAGGGVCQGRKQPAFWGKRARARETRPLHKSRPSAQRGTIWGATRPPLPARQTSTARRETARRCFPPPRTHSGFPARPPCATRPDAHTKCLLYMLIHTFHLFCSSASEPHLRRKIIVNSSHLKTATYTHMYSWHIKRAIS